jgi:hypothetical protein
MIKKIVISVLFLLTIVIYVFSDDWIEVNGTKNLTIKHFGFVNGSPQIYFGTANVDALAHGDHYHFYFTSEYLNEDSKKALVALVSTAMNGGFKVMARTNNEDKIIKFWIVQ